MAETFLAECPHCHKSLRAPLTLTKTVVRCKFCRRSFFLSGQVSQPQVEPEPELGIVVEDADPEDAAYEALGDEPQKTQFSTTIAVRCSHCGQEGEAPREFAGRTIRCRACGQNFYAGTTGFELAPEPEPVPQPSPFAAPERRRIREPKSRLAAALLALFLGFIGIHEFYLGKPNRGWTILSVWAGSALSLGCAPPVGIVGIFGLAAYLFFDAIRLLVMDAREFDERCG